MVSDIDAVQTTDDLETEKTAETTAAITPTPSETTEAPPSSPVPVSAAPAESPAAAITTDTTTSTGWFSIFGYFPIYFIFENKMTTREMYLSLSLSFKRIRFVGEY